MFEWKIETALQCNIKFLSEVAEYIYFVEDKLWSYAEWSEINSSLFDAVKKEGH